MVETLGITASVIVLISFLFSDEKTIRIYNIVGAAAFVAYGIFIHSFSVSFVNGALIFVHIYHLTHDRGEGSERGKPD